MSNRINTLFQLLSLTGCNGCEVRCAKPAKYDGNYESKIIFVSDEPFQPETQDILNRIITAMGFDPGKFSFTSAVRGVHGSISACRPLIQFELEQLKSKLVILLGQKAAESVLDTKSTTPMKDLAGKFFTDERYPDTKFFVMYHPRWATATAKLDPEKLKKTKALLWEHAQLLRDYIQEEKLYEAI